MNREKIRRDTYVSNGCVSNVNDLICEDGGIRCQECLVFGAYKEACYAYTKYIPFPKIETKEAVSQGAEPFTSEDLRAVPRETRSTPRGEGGSKQTDHLSLLYV